MSFKVRVGETLVAIRVFEEVYSSPYTTPRQNPLEPPLGISDYSSYEWLQRRALSFAVPTLEGLWMKDITTSAFKERELLGDREVLGSAR